MQVIDCVPLHNPGGHATVHALAQCGATEGVSALPLAGSVKACFGHTEGAAGIHGAMLAILAVQQQAAPALMHLRTLNAYVSSAIADWTPSCNLSASAPKVRPHYTNTFLLSNSQLATFDRLSKGYEVDVISAGQGRNTVCPQHVSVLSGRGGTAMALRCDERRGKLFRHERSECTCSLRITQGVGPHCI